MDIEEAMDILGGARIRFWICPVEGHRFVEWKDDVAHCGTCDRTSADPRNPTTERQGNDG